MASKIEVAVRLMEHLCAHDWHGYDQARRWGDGEGYCNVPIDGTTYQVAQGDRDCSSSIVECMRVAGIDVGGATYTGNYINGFTSSGNFKWHPMSDGYTAKRGDVYLNIANHTALCTSPSPDMLAEFAINERGGITGGQVGDQTGRESHTRGYYSCPWDGILEYIGGGAAGGSKGMLLQLWASNMTDAQLWQPIWVNRANNILKLKNKATGRMLNVVGGRKTAGTGVWLYPEDGTDAELWKLVPRQGSYYPASVAPFELVPLVNKALRLDSVNGGKTQGTQLQVFDKNNTDAQALTIRDLGTGWWVIENTASGLVVDAVDGGKAA